MWSPNWGDAWDSTWKAPCSSIWQREALRHPSWCSEGSWGSGISANFWSACGKATMGSEMRAFRMRWKAFKASSGMGPCLKSALFLVNQCSVCEMRAKSLMWLRKKLQSPMNWRTCQNCLVVAYPEVAEVSCDLVECLLVSEQNQGKPPRCSGRSILQGSS